MIYRLIQIIALQISLSAIDIIKNNAITTLGIVEFLTTRTILEKYSTISRAIFWTNASLSLNTLCTTCARLAWLPIVSGQSIVAFWSFGTRISWGSTAPFSSRWSRRSTWSAITLKNITYLFVIIVNYIRMLGLFWIITFMSYWPDNALGDCFITYACSRAQEWAKR